MSKDKQAESQVKKCETELKKPVSINNVKNMLELVFPVLIWLRSEGKAPKRIKTVKGKTDVDENGQLELDQDTDSELDKEIESMKMKTAYAIFDRDVFKKGLLKLAVTTKDSPKWTNGAEYIKKLPDGCHWKNLWSAFDSYVSDKEDSKKIDTESVLNLRKHISDSIKLYLKSRHWNPALSRVRLRKLLMKALEVYFKGLELVLKQEAARQELEKINSSGNMTNKSSEGTEPSQNMTKDGKIKYNWDMLTFTNNPKEFHKSLDELNKMIPKEKIENWEFGEDVEVYPCQKEERDKLICTAARNCLKKNCKGAFGGKKEFEVVYDKVKKFLDDTGKIKPIEATAKINGKDKSFYVSDKTTVNDLMGLAKRVLNVNDTKQMLVAAEINKDFTILKIKVKNGQKFGLDLSGLGARAKLNAGGKLKVCEYLDKGNFYLFDQAHKSAWEKIAGTAEDNTEPKNESESDSNKNSGGGSKPSNSNSSGGGSKPADPKNPTDETSTKDNAAEAKKLKDKIEELKKNKVAKENERTKNKKRYTDAVNNQGKAEKYLNKNAYGAPYDKIKHLVDNKWKERGLLEWQAHFEDLIQKNGEEVKDGFSKISTTLAKNRLEQVKKAIDNQKKVTEDYEEFQKLRADINEIDEEIKNTQKQLDALQND